MPIDGKIILYSLAKTFGSVLNIGICENTKSYIKSTEKNFTKLPVDEKMYYIKYSVKLAQCLMEYLEGITYFEYNMGNDNNIVHDFRLTWKKDNIAYISMAHTSINVQDIIPEKIMKICKYKKNTNICKFYSEEYKKININAYEKIKSKKKYSEINEKNKNTFILEPICNLVVNTLSKKRKCANNLYSHLLNEDNRIVFKLYKNKFTMYDFGIDLGDIESFRMKLNHGNEITITFNNKTEFMLCLHTNASEIKEHLSVKFRTSFKNMDELFAVSSSSV